MEQIDLIELPPRGGWFTFAENSTSDDTHDLDQCLVFVPTSKDEKYDLSFLERVMDVPFLQTNDFVEMGDVLWFIQRAEGVVVAGDTSLILSANRGGIGHGFGVLKLVDERWVKKIWTYAEVFHNCFNLEKIGSNCGDCELRGASCFFSVLPELGCPDNLVPLKQNNASILAISSLDVAEDIKPYLKKVSARTPWELVSPKTATGMEFTSSRLTVANLSMWSIPSRKKELSARARMAAASRKAVHVCKATCVFYPRCPMAEPPYRGAPAECQDDIDTGGQRTWRYNAINRDVPGPFDQAQLDDSAESYWRDLPRGPRENMELIAYNSGISIWLYGYEMVLGKMDENLMLVEFYRPSRLKPEVKTFSFEDAVLLCTTPYQQRGKYVMPYGGEGSEFKQPPRPMTDVERHTYMEVCQHGYLNNRYYSRPSQIVITGVSWSPYGYVAISADTDYGYPLTFKTPLDIMKYTTQFPFIYKKFMRTKEAVEMSRQETSSDK